MQYLKDTAFILRRINFGDSDRYITLFTKHHGKVEVVARGVRKITSRRAGACEPLNLIEFQAVKTLKNHILTEVAIINSFENLKKDLKSIEKAFLMCELVDAVMPFGVKHIEVFDLLHRASEKMLENERNMAYFQAKLLSLLGFWDGKAAFRNALHVQNVFENTIERKLKTRSVFE